MSLTEQRDRDRQGRTVSRTGAPAPYGITVGTSEVVSTAFATSQTSTTGQEKGKTRDEGQRTSAIFAPTPRQHGDVESMNVEDDLSSGEENSAIGWSDMQSHFSMLWKRKGIYKAKQQKWIQEKAYAVVNDHSRILKLRFTQEEFDSLLMTAAESIADQYLKASRVKVSSQTSTPLTDSYADMARIVMAEAITVEDVHDGTMDHDLRGVQTAKTRSPQKE